MTPRRTFLPIALLSLAGLAACGSEEPFSDKTYVGCLNVDSVTFRADGTITAVLDGEQVPEEEQLSYTKSSDTEAVISVPGTQETGTANLLDDGTVLFEFPLANITHICTPQEDA